MKTAKKTILSLVVLSLALFLPATARADWDPQDPHKYLQSPDLTTNGMDVNATGYYEWLEVPGAGEAEFFIPKVLADDFECRQTGPITDIHIWGSWKDDLLPQDLTGALDPGNVAFHLGIWDDIPAFLDPADPNIVLEHSRPGDLLWSGFFFPGDFTFRDKPVDGESWYDPNNPDQYDPAPSDQNIWQYNFLIDIDPEAGAMVDPAFQQQGTADKPITYWLSVLAVPDPEGLGDPPVEPMFGWKTRDPNEGHYMDDAVWTDLTPILDGTEGDFQDPEGQWYTLGPWAELRYPDGHAYGPQAADQLGQSIDLAFVITPEPATLLVLALGLIPALLRKRRKA